MEIKNTFKIILQALPVLIFSYTAQVLMKIGSSVLAGTTWEQAISRPAKTLGLIVWNWQIMLGFVLAGIGALFYLFALSKNDFSVVFPILGAVGFLVLPFVSWFFLKESVTLRRIIGTIIIAAGMVIVALD